MTDSPGIETVASIVSRGAFAELVGRNEGDQLEVKSKPYALDEAGGRYELAKDVSAFANGNGGHLLIGLEHHRVDSAALDRISGLCLIKVTDFPGSQYTGVIREHVYPEVKDIQANWAPSDSDPRLGIGVVFIPPQPEQRRPFLIARVQEDEALVKQIVFGLARRTRADAQPLSKQQLHEIVRLGMSPQMQRLVSIEAKLDVLLGARQEALSQQGENTLLQRLAELAEEE